MTSTPNKKTNINWHTLIVLAILYAYFYGFMEWLFFVTKPSSLSTLTLIEKLEALLITSGVIATIALTLLALLALPALITKNSRLIFLACIAPALILSINILILVDNFTYNVLNAGIIYAEGFWRLLYAIGFLLLLAWVTRQIHSRIHKRRKPASFPAFGLLTVSLILILPAVFSNAAHRSSINHNSATSSAKRPNILILLGDGLNSQYLSLYGYNHDTTPFLKEMAKNSLLIQNAFTNASGTTASTTSLLTGKEPIDVKVYRYPDVLTGTDSFEHLPGILRRAGYKNVEIGTSYYLDAHELNLLDGFDIVNNQAEDQSVFNSFQAILGNSFSAHFTSTIFQRASERLLHIFFIETMRNPLAEVYNPDERLSDQERVAEILDLVDHSKQPVFVLGYFLDTHGPHFLSTKQAFSNSGDDSEWDQGQYEQAIASFDNNVKKVYDHLVETGQLDNTILIVSTDHGYKYTTFNRIPMLIHFPKDEHVGTRTNNIQMIDLPVTLLDYLHLPKPAWMPGLSFLDSETPGDRKIFSVTAGSPTKIIPPFYQIKIIQVTVCQKLYLLNVQDNIFTTTTARGYVSPCDESQLPPGGQIHKAIIDYLEQYDYDVSSLR